MHIQTKHLQNIYKDNFFNTRSRQKKSEHNGSSAYHSFNFSR